MTGTVEKAALDHWYCIGCAADLPVGCSATRLLGSDLSVVKDDDETVTVVLDEDERLLPIKLRFGYVWTTLGEPERDVVPIPEADEPDRRYVACGAVTVKASGLRIVENFLDMAHFPFVHTDILGSEAHTEVEHYDCEIRRDVDEVWATNCKFIQPKAALSSEGAIMTDYIYRVATPFVTLLYKTCPNADDRWDVICLFVQPMDEDLCRAHPLMLLIDEATPLSDLIAFQLDIFLQDRIILENQRPRLLPLEARAEIPTRADASSIAYRRWLKEKGLKYGTTLAGV
ncbi:aromatic ring-hydroxylating dioxygenase subunit alpha [Mesorhizobium xinjiangense]|uniref:aromatic ring-hydroxylating dioxygenase subunit alpha n=1 Tax=Mesorhizobium xinjiangense TaxID=2678685 RepID=UPI0038B2E187